MRAQLDANGNETPPTHRPASRAKSIISQILEGRNVDQVLSGAPAGSDAQYPVSDGRGPRGPAATETKDIPILADKTGILEGKRVADLWAAV